MVNTPFGSFPGGNFSNAPGTFGNVAGFNPFTGFSPGFNGGINPTFGNSSGVNTNFAFNPFNGFNPLLGNPAGIAGFSGTPFGSNALLNNPFNPNGQGLANTLGSNPLIASPINTSNGLQPGLGSNPLINSPVNATAPGQINNALTNPGLFNPASNASFSSNPAMIASGHLVSGNGIPVNGNNLVTNPFLDPFVPNNGFNTFTGGFGSGFASFGGGLLAGGFPVFFNNGISTIGFGAGYPYYYGYGDPFGYTIGLSPYDQAMYKYQKYKLNASRYNLNNARATAAYSAANFYNDLAAATAAGSYKTSTGIKPSYSITTGNSRLTPAMRHQMAVQARAQMIPKDKLIDSSGRVLWPSSAPMSPSYLAKARADVDSSVAKAAADHSKTGRATVRDVVDAQDKLRSYGTQALDHLKSDNPAEATGLASFLASLDYALTTMGDGARPVGGDHTRPDNAPKTGGDVLKESLTPSRSQPASDAPKSGGEILKDSTKPDRSNGSK